MRDDINRDTRAFLKAIVAIWLTNGNQPVDGGNDPREFVEAEWVDAAEMTEELIEKGYVKNASDPGTYSGNFADLGVWPTDKGVFEVLL